MTTKTKLNATTHDKLIRMYKTELEIANRGLASLDF